MRDSGMRAFQANFWSWSSRRRGNENRTHNNRKTMNEVLTKNHSTPGITSSGSHGTIGLYPPRNNVVPIAANAIMCAVSAKKNPKMKRMPVYSVNGPVMSSDSATGMSNGGSAISAIAPARNKRNSARPIPGGHTM